jgi:hypothetical protein
LVGLKVISTGETGVDRVALEVARSLGVTTGGWAARHYMTEAGPDLGLKVFGLVEYPANTAPPRIRATVRMADGTVWFGSQRVPQVVRLAQTCAAHQKPFVLNPDAATLTAWMAEEAIRVLHVAGSRSSRLDPATERHVRTVLREALHGLSRGEMA